VLCSDFLFRRVIGSQQLPAQRQTGNTKAIGQEPEVTDANEAFGKHVQE
jgi:hypothetical protein